MGAPSHRAYVPPPHIPQVDRYQLFRAMVGSSLLYGAGSRVPSAHVRSQLELTEIRNFRIMTRERKAPDEEWVSIHRSRHRHAQAFPDDATSYVWHAAVTAGHGWYGHVPRHPASPAGQVESWRSLDWWRAMQCIRSQRDPEGRHSRRGWQRALARLMEGCYGDDLESRLASRTSWTQALPIFSEWCVQSFGGRLPDPPRGPKRRRGV